MANPAETSLEPPSLSPPIPDDVPGRVQRLLAHRELGGAPLEELEWLAAHGSLESPSAGDCLVRAGMKVDDEGSDDPRRRYIGLWAVLSCTVSVFIDRGAGPKRAATWRPGDITGILPYSRIDVLIGDVVVREPGEFLLIPKSEFPEMIRTCPNVTAILVHVMLDRARQFTKSDLHDEKMASLGKLSAGLAHELNNPASSASRNAMILEGSLDDMASAARALGGVNLDDAKLAALDAFRRRCSESAAGGVPSPLERSDREEAIADWLEARHLDESLASSIVEAGATVSSLDELARFVDGPALDPAVRWIAADCSVRTLLADVRQAVTRIHDLVSSIKRFTYMDRAASHEAVDVGQGLRDSVAVLRSKARGKDVGISVNVEYDLPPVLGLGGELNQVWANVIDNAIDAVAQGGRVAVGARRALGEVVVTVVDDGAGIPPEMLDRIFDPFVTTKPVGKGTGLGLDIARRLVHQHEGEIEVASRPGRTEFTIRLPASIAPAANLRMS